MLQLGDLVLTAPSELREQLAAVKTLKAKATLCRRLRPDNTRLNNPFDAAKLALRSLARRIALLDNEIAELDTQLTPLVATAAPRTTALLGISTGHAGQLLITAGQNIDRLRGEGAFAALCGASPIPVASGKRGRHRLNPGGDRQANRALHMIAVCRLRYCPATRAYAERRTTEGKRRKRSCDASSDTSLARSTRPSEKISDISPPLDIFSNVPGQITLTTKAGAVQFLRERSR